MVINIAVVSMLDLKTHQGEEKNCGAYKSELKETDVEKRKLKKKVDLQNAFLIIL